MNLPPRQHLLLLVAIGAVALLAADRLVRAPLFKAYQSRSARLESLRKSVTQGSLLLDRSSSLRGRWQEMQTNALSPVPSIAENELLKAFDRWSEESRIGVSAIKPLAKQSPEGIDTLECRVDAFGNLAAVARFLYNIESDPIAVRIGAVELVSRDDRGEQLTLGLQVSGLLRPNPSTR